MRGNYLSNYDERGVLINKYRTKIKAVHDQDLKDFLKSLSLLEDFQNQKLRCLFCNEIITDSNLVSVLPYKGEIKLVCSNIGCYEQIATKKESSQ